MGITKTNLFTQGQNDLAKAARVFSNPARVAILHYLLKANACINGDLVHELGLAQATISQHLRELKEIGIVQGTIEGASMSYCINDQKWAEIKQQFNALFDQHAVASEDGCC